MKIVLKGEAGKYKYAVEQMLLTVFPDERPEYVLKKPQEDCLSVSLSRAEMYSVSVCMLKRDGKVFKGMARELFTEQRSLQVSKSLYGVLSQG